MIKSCYTHKFVSRYGFLKLAIISSPDFDEFIRSCKDKKRKKSLEKLGISTVNKDDIIVMKATKS